MAASSAIAGARIDEALGLGGKGVEMKPTGKNNLGIFPFYRRTPMLKVFGYAK
jgi:hypothetical protein